MYKSEFPDYDDELIIPKGFEDWSYHNDVCPCVGKEVCGTDVRVWQDYKDPTKREYEEHLKYALAIYNMSYLVFYYESDNWEEIEKLINAVQ